MEEIKKLKEKWESEKGSYIPNAPIYGMFIEEIDGAIKRQELIDNNKKLYQVEYISGDGSCYTHNTSFFTNDEDVAKNYVDKFNYIIEKAKYFYKDKEIESRYDVDGNEHTDNTIKNTEYYFKYHHFNEIKAVIYKEITIIIK